MPVHQYALDMGCCLFAVASWISPRLAIFVVWVFGLFDHRLSDAFSSFWLGFFGFLFLPWTTLAYAACYAPQAYVSSSGALNPAGVNGFGWVVVAFAFVVDLMSYTSGDRARRQRAATA